MKKVLYVMLFCVTALSCVAQADTVRCNTVNISQDTSDGSGLSWAEFQATVKFYGGDTIITPNNGCIGVIKLAGLYYQETRANETTTIRFKNGKPF